MDRDREIERVESGPQRLRNNAARWLAKPKIKELLRRSHETAHEQKKKGAAQTKKRTSA